MGGGGGSKKPDKAYQRAQQAELDRLTTEENKRLRAMQRGRLGRASLLSGLDIPGKMVVPGSAGGGAGGAGGSLGAGGGGSSGGTSTGSGSSAGSWGGSRGGSRATMALK